MSTSLLVLLISVVILFILARTVLFLVQVEGWSMYPTYQHGDRLLALRYWLHRWLHRGQIVVWQLPSDSRLASLPESMCSRFYIKRIVGLPGDKTAAPIAELPGALSPLSAHAHGDQGSRIWHIPAGHCFVMGDTPGFDSTLFGPLPLHALRGVVLVKLPRRVRGPAEPDFTTYPPLLSHPPQKNT